MSRVPQTLDGAYLNLISFVPQRASTSNHDHLKGKKDIQKQELGNNLSGESAKSFYESLINGCSNTGGNNSNSKRVKREKNVKKKRTKSSCTNEQPKSTAPELLDPGKQKREIHKLFRAAENGDCEEMSRVAHSGLPIDSSDTYGWTPIMCAAYAGHLDCVRLCLTLGADRSLRNHASQTAEDLAHLAGHSGVAEAISTFDEESESCSRQNVGQQQTSQSSRSRPEPGWCDTCGVSVSESQSGSHNTSVIHLLNSGHKPAPPAYLIPQTNRGFQMLLRSGWNEHQGLGSRGDGNKYPVRTQLKRDRKGLGVDTHRGHTRRSRVTHFEPNDTQAVARPDLPLKRTMSAKKAAKQALKKKKKRAQRLEQELRFEFNSLS